MPDREYFDQVLVDLTGGNQGRVGMGAVRPIQRHAIPVGHRWVVNCRRRAPHSFPWFNVEQEFGGCSKRRAALGASDLQLCSLRGLDLNQRPLGYETGDSCRPVRLVALRAVPSGVRVADVRPVPPKSAWFVCKWFCTKASKIRRRA